MELAELMRELEALGTERTKKSYLSRGAREPLFGVATGAMKPLAKQTGIDQALADALWDTGNYDAMYFAGIIANVRAMTEADFERWISGAYSPMVAEHIVSVTLAESDLAQAVASRWIRSGDEIRTSAGWACYEWLLGWRPDEYFERDAVGELLELAATMIDNAPPAVQRIIRDFVVAVGVSYRPLHEEALKTAEAIGAAGPIRTAVEKGRVGFKRRAVRC